MEAFLDALSPLHKRQDSWGSAPAASSAPAAPASGSSHGGAPSTSSTGLLPFQQYIAAHAVLSTLGFVVALPVGALVARWVRTHSDRWFRAHWVIQWVVAFPLILTGFALGVASVAKNDRLPLSDTHKRWGVALFCLYLVQLGLGALVHFVKVPFLQYRGRPAQNYAHGALGVFIIGAGFYQVRTGFRVEWPAYAGTQIGGGANAAWIVWLVLVVTAYAVGLGLLPRQYAQEHAARRRRGYQTDSTELMAKQQGQVLANAS
ncbi:cytochrome b561 domain-containing protein [Phanerochaete sordida]|uniref:Cytochrome b561 domain-containing protein n=1 Tax=Phanerochaete sordida TaxID=48140 RepID=A0A9P3G8Z0_9APHY|nr:cytochrome b561 domain-containing protein [Phanerochaete sordida]